MGEHGGPIEFETEVIAVIKRTPHIKSFRFHCPKDASFKAGQIFRLTIMIGAEESTKHFSFSNSPTERGYVEFTKRITDSIFSQALDRLTVGNFARILMPFGLFTFAEENGKAAFLTGGIGITAMRSICKYLMDTDSPVDIVLLYSNRTENDIAFYQDLREMEESKDTIKIIYTLTSPEVRKDEWKGRTGRIDMRMIREEIPDYRERVFYLSGPPSLVDSLNAILTGELMISKELVRTERYLGYK